MQFSAVRSRFLVALVFGFALFPTDSRAQSGVDADASVEVLDALIRTIVVPFETGQNALAPAAYPIVDVVGEAMTTHPDLLLEIQGHADASGSTRRNHQLSLERAESVRAYLIARHWIDPDRVRALGFGESDPAAPNVTSAGRTLNRRVTFRVAGRRPTTEPAPVAAQPAPVHTPDPDSLQDTVEQAVREALRAQSDTLESDRIAFLEERLVRLEEEVTVRESQLAGGPLSRPRIDQGFAVLFLTGVYLGSETPVVLGIRADVPTELVGRARFQPELATGFGRDSRTTSLNANLVLPIRMGDTRPFLGAGLGFNNVDDWQAVLNVVFGAEHRFAFGMLFGELLLQDFGSMARLAIGFRQNL